MGIDIITGIFSESFWWVAVIIVNASVAITQAIKTKFEIKGVWQEVTAWITASALSVGSWAVGIISLGEPTWLSIIALCVVTSLSSCGYYDIPAIKEFVTKWFSFGKLLKKE